jgi:hypothetical protein
MSISSDAMERRLYAVQEARVRLAEAAENNDRWRGPTCPEEAVTVQLQQARRIETYMHTGQILSSDEAAGSAGGGPQT